MAEIEPSGNRIPKNWKKWVIIGLIITNIGFLSGFAVSISQLNQAQRENEDFIEQNIDLEAEIAEYQKSLDDIDYNTELSGSFYVVSTYNHNHDLNPYIITTTVSYEEYFGYRNSLEHPSHSKTTWSEVAEVLISYIDTTSVYTLADFIRDNVDYSTDECILNGLLTFCQDRGDFTRCIHYIEDGTEDFAKYPIETLCEGCGDCEDKSILFASMAKSLGYEVRLVLIPGHCMVAVHFPDAPTHSSGWYLDVDGDYYYLCETTGYGYLVGDLPIDHQDETFYSFPI